jgi:hypothetical protein
MFTTTLTSKWAHKCGFEVKKAELKQNGNFNLETTYSGLGNGIKLNANTNGKDIFSGFEYRRPNLTMLGETDGCLTNTVLNGVFTQKSVLAGVQLNYNQKKSLFDYDLALGYDNPLYFFGVEAVKSLSAFKVGGFYKVNKALTLATRVEGTPEDPARLITLGLNYKPECRSVIKAKVNSRMESGLSVQYDCAKGVKFTGALRGRLNDLSSTTYGVEFNLC